MIIDCISDLHGDLPELEGGDLLIIAGDITGNDRIPQWAIFYDWLKKQKYRKKILIAGNHDGFLEQCCSTEESKEVLGDEWEDGGFEYLLDSGTEFEGLKIWGSPWTPNFCDWHFMLPRGAALKAKWDLIPNDTDILITHGPPHGILDQTKRNGKFKKHCGCIDLRQAVERIKPKYHVFGHIHEGYGQHVEVWGPEIFQATKFVNCSLMNEDYEFINKPIRLGTHYEPING